jgi:hypothetical protein
VAAAAVVSFGDIIVYRSFKGGTWWWVAARDGSEGQRKSEEGEAEVSWSGVR